MQRVLITGAGGGIGRSLRETLRGVYPVLRLSDRVALAPARDGEEIDRTEISDMAAVERMVEGVDGIIHLGGNSGENTWDVILQSNIIGVYNVFEAARRAGVQRVSWQRATMRSGFTRVRRRSTIGYCRGRTVATASARRFPRRSPASTPTSTRSAFCACGSAISARGRSTKGDCRFGSARAI